MFITTPSAEDAPDTSPIVAFAQSLNNYADNSYHASDIEEVYRNMVVSFDMKIIIATCRKNSPSYYPQLCEFYTLSKQFFSTVGGEMDSSQPHEIWYIYVCVIARSEGNK